MGFGDWLGDLGGGISSLFGGGGGGGGADIPSYGPMDTGVSGVQADVPSYGAGSTFPGAGTPAGGGGGGWGDWLSKIGGGVSDFTKMALPAAQLGATGMGIYGAVKGQQQGAEQMAILKRQQANQERMSAPASAAGATLTGAGSQALMGGALPPQQEQAVQQYEAQIRSQLQAYMAHIGMTDSTAMASMEAQIAQQVAAYRQQVAESLYGQGLKGIGTALGPSQAAGNTAAAVVGGTTGQLSNANSALAKLLGQGA